MKRIVNSRLMWVLESKDLLVSEQCGFRKYRCTADHLVHFDSYIRNAFITRENAVAIYFDVEKAYDIKWKHGTLCGLYDLILEVICLPLLMGICLIDCSR